MNKVFQVNYLLAFQTLPTVTVISRTGQEMLPSGFITEAHEFAIVNWCPHVRIFTFQFYLYATVYEEDNVTIPFHELRETERRKHFTLNLVNVHDIICMG
jgi:hypothetical protein